MTSATAPSGLLQGYAMAVLVVTSLTDSLCSFMHEIGGVRRQPRCTTPRAVLKLETLEFHRS